MPPIPLQNSSFDLDVSGIAGFFGGEESFSAISNVHLIRGRRWLGWYNSPGSYFVAKKYGVLARGRFWDGLFPGVNVEPAEMLGLNGKRGPRFLGVHSGTKLDKTGHLASLFVNYCSGLKEDQVVGSAAAQSNSFLTIVHLGDFPREIEDNNGEIASSRLAPFDPIAVIPILYSVGAAVVSAVFGDWFCFSMIVLGIFCNGIASLVLGSGILRMKGPTPSKHSPPADGIFFTNGTGTRVVVVKGNAKIVGMLTAGSFALEYGSQPQYGDIGFSAFILIAQFLLQLFIVPQGELFGQIMFLSSLGVSWLHNAYLASIDREELQMKIVMDVLLKNSHTWTVRFEKYTSLAVFAATTLQARDTQRVMDAFIPNDTRVWRNVKAQVAEGIERNLDHREMARLRDADGLDESEQGLAKDMLSFASEAYQAAKELRAVQETRSKDS
ncbi:hypothetical protein CPC08DRAFT_706529 [Agrocybe pediades]|nr:hypothetical protein CPC08DRAFT_706529 [Agrocybe pediades]